MSMKVEILGPLPRGEAFHVHAAGCADIARRADYQGIRRERGGAWTMDATTEREVVEDVYSDFLDESPESTWESYAGDIRFFPCCHLS